VKSLLTVLLICLSTGAAALPSIHIGSWRRISAEAQDLKVDKLVRLTGRLIGGRGSSGAIGSGMFISPKHFLTAYHVIDGVECPDIKIYTHLKVRASNVPIDPQGKRLQCRDVTLQDVEGDLAILEFSPPVTEYAKLDTTQVFNGGTFDVLAYTINHYMVQARNCKIGETIPDNAKINVRNYAGAQHKMTAANFFLADCFLDSGMSGGNVVYWKEDVPYAFGVAHGVLMKSVIEMFDATRVLGIGLNPPSVFARISASAARFPGEYKVIADTVAARERHLEGQGEDK